MTPEKWPRFVLNLGDIYFSQEFLSFLESCSKDQVVNGQALFHMLCLASLFKNLNPCIPFKYRPCSSRFPFLTKSLNEKIAS